MDTWLAWDPKSGDASRCARGLLSWMPRFDPEAGRCRRLCAQQSLVFELGPEAIGDGDVQPLQILFELVDRSNSEEDGANPGMRKWELEGCRGQRDVVAIAHGLDLLRPSQDGWLGWNVVVPGAGRRVDQDSAVEDPSDDDRDRALLAQRQQLVHRHLVEQRVAAGDQENVDVARFDKPGQHWRLVHAGADRTRRPILPELRKRREPGRAGCFEMVVRIVEEQDVEPVEP